MSGVGILLLALTLIAIGVRLNQLGARDNRPIRRPQRRKLPRILFCEECRLNVEPTVHHRCPHCGSEALYHRAAEIRFPRPA